MLKGLRTVALAGLFFACCLPVLAVVVYTQQSEYQPPVPVAVVPTKTTPEYGGQFAPSAPGPSPTVVWKNPVGWRVSSPFGWRPGDRPGTWEWHGGVDLAGGPFAFHSPVTAIQDATVFDIRYDVSRYRGGGLCVEIQNAESYEEIPTLIGYCHLAPYQVRGHVYDAETGKGIPNAVVYLTYYDDEGGRHVVGERECGMCDEDNNGVPDFDYTVREGKSVIKTDDSGYYCYDYSTPDGGHTAVVELPPDWEPETPTEVSFEIRVDVGVRAYDTEIDFYAVQPFKPTPTPTPTPTIGPGGEPATALEAAPRAPSAAPAGGTITYNYGPRYVPGWGPPLTFHTPIFQNKTVLGFIGRTGKETGPHLHLFVSRIQEEYRINVYGYNRPRYPDGTLVPRNYLIVPYNYMRGQVDPMQFLPLANNDFGLAFMDSPMSLPPPGHYLGGEGEWWSPGDYWSYGGGGRLRGYNVWRWFDWNYGAFCGICPCMWCPKCSKCK